MSFLVQRVGLYYHLLQLMSRVTVDAILLHTGIIINPFTGLSQVCTTWKQGGSSRSKHPNRMLQDVDRATSILAPLINSQVHSTLIK